MADKIKEFIEKVAEECPHWVYADFDREMLVEYMQKIWDELNG